MKYPVWSKSAFLTFILSALLVTSLLTSPIMADEHKVTVPINQVVKTEKLSAEQLAKSEVTVPISWVSESYLEEHNLIGKKSSQAKQEESESPSNNIPDGTYTRKPKITSDQNESIDLSNFHFEFSYDEGDLQKSTINFTITSEAGKLTAVKLMLEEQNKLTPQDSSFDSTREKFSTQLETINEGDIYEGKIEISTQNGSYTAGFEVYPREFVNIADDDEINVCALYNIWYSDPSYSMTDFSRGANWTGKHGAPSQPTLGKYSSFDDEVVARHIDWATGHGIDAFMINWWGNSDMKKRLRDYLSNPLADEIEYFILWDVHSSSVTRSESGTFDFSQENVADRFKEDVRYIIRNLISDQNYLELDGKPVIYLYDEDDYSGSFPSMMQNLDELSQSVSGKKIYWIGDNARPLSSTQKRQRETVEGITDFNPIVHWFPWIWDPGNDWKLTRKEVKKRYVPQTRENHFDALELERDYIPTIIPGFSKPISDLPIVERTEAGFKYEIAKAKELIDPELKTILISSFNGWLEDHQIEPGEEYGKVYVNIIKKELAGSNFPPSLRNVRLHLEFRFNEFVVPEGSDNRKLTARVSSVKGFEKFKAEDAKYSLEIGTVESLEIIGKGWSIPAKNDTKSWRWGVGANKKSSLFIPKTEGLKYLLIEAAPISDEIEADIYLNGKLVDHIDFEQGWQTYTVELPS